MTTTISDIPDEVLSIIIHFAGPSSKIRLVSKKFDEQYGQAAVDVFRNLSKLKSTDEYCLLRHLVSEAMPSFGATTGVAMMALHGLYGRIGECYSQKDFKKIHEALTVNCLSKFEQECQEASLIEFASIVELEIQSGNLKDSFSSTEEHVKHIRQWFQNNSAKIQALGVLELCSEELTRLPPEIALFKNLSDLQIQQSLIPFLPKEIWSLKNLKALTVNNSPLEIFDVPDSNLPQLEGICLINTKLKKYPQGIEKFKLTLDNLNLSDNKISDIPESIGNLAQLTSIKLTHTLLTTLPKSIGSLAKLIELQASWGEILSLPDELVFQSLPNICNMPQIYNYRWYAPLVNFLKEVPQFGLNVVAGTAMVLMGIGKIVIEFVWECALLLLEIVKFTLIVAAATAIMLGVMLFTLFIIVSIQVIIGIMLPQTLIELFYIVAFTLGTFIALYITEVMAEAFW